MSTPKFKVGDKIRRTSSGVGVAKGYTYEVKSINEDGDPCIRNDNGSVEAYSSNYFELVAEASPKPTPSNPLVSLTITSDELLSVLTGYIQGRHMMAQAVAEVVLNGTDVELRFHP